MNLEKIINSTVNEFKQNMIDFCKNESKKDLTPEIACKFIAQVKEQVQQIGLRTIQGYFESRDISGQHIEYNSKRYIYKCKSTKEFVTVLGKVSIQRKLYQPSRGGESHSPLDVKLGIDREYVTPDVREIVLFTSAHNTPEESSQIIDKCSLFSLHPTSIKRIINDAGELIEEHKETIDTTIYQKEQESELITGDIQVISLDGVNVLLNQTGNKKGRPTERPQKHVDKESSAYKNAMCGSISFYNIESENDKLIHKRIESKYVSRMPEERYSTFKREFEKEIQHNANQTVPKIFLTDAHKSIMGYIKDNPVFEGFEQLIDFYHASEHLSFLSEAIFGKSTQQAQDWYKKYYDILKNDQSGVTKLIRSADYFMQSCNLPKAKNKDAKKQLNYFTRHKQMMNYYEFIQKGWPIGSGVIEAACKSIVKQRMCRSGQRWTIKGGQSILTLRTYIKSGRWNDFNEAFYKIKYELAA